MRFLLLISLTLLSFTQPDDDLTPPPFPTDPPTHIILISIDGARPDAIQQAQTPIMQGLAEAGAVAWDARTTFPPATVPGHASLLTGLHPDDHGVLHNSYREQKLDLPTVLSIAAVAGIPTAMIVGKNRLDQFHYPDTVFYDFALTGDGSVVDVVINRLEVGDRMLFVHLPNPDFFGHSIGWMTAPYLYELGNTDYQVGRILAALDELDIAETTLVIITADHGGHDTEHGQDIPEDMNIPLIVHGPGVIAGTILENATITQITPTILWALGLDVAEAMDDGLWAAFVETDEN